jgi:hypothetical protein
MTFKPRIWFPISFILSAVNLVAIGFASGAAEPWHAAGHGALALGFGLWAQRLRLSSGRSGIPELMEGRMDALEDEVNRMGHELGEAHERLDFAERLLAQRPEERGLGPQR